MTLREQASERLTAELIAAMLDIASDEYDGGRLRYAILDALQPLFDQMARERNILEVAADTIAKSNLQMRSDMALLASQVESLGRFYGEQNADLRAKLTQAEDTVLDLRAAMDRCATEDGWPDTFCADVYETSRRVVPDPPDEPEPLVKRRADRSVTP